MNFSFLSPDAGVCTVRLWASGRYGFSLPKKVEISTGLGVTHTFLYFNKKVRPAAELSKRTIVNIAIAQFLRGDHQGRDAVEIDADTLPYDGELTSVRPTVPRAPLRVRPGKSHARIKPTSGPPTAE